MTLMVNICVAECGNNGFLAFMQSQLYKSFMCKLSHTLYTHVISYPAGPTFDDIPLCAANSNHLEVRICNPPFQRRVWECLKGARAKSQQEIPPPPHTHFFPFFFSFPSVHSFMCYGHRSKICSREYNPAETVELQDTLHHSL